MAGVREHRWHAMGTDCHVMVHGDAHDAAPTDARRAVVALVADLEARWSRFLPTSELTRINKRSGQVVTVSDLTVYAVNQALLARERTGGRFDPTILPALRAAGYDRDFSLVGARSEHRAAAGRAPSAGAEVEVDVEAGTVRVERGASIDLGGIGKGLAADLAATSVTRAPGVLGACVNLGGDLRACGTAPTSAGWGIAIDDPADPGTTLVTVAIADGAVATSSTRRRRWRQQGRDAHHIIDPRTGDPVADPVWSTTVLANTAELAEVLATAAIVAGPEEGPGLLAAAGTPALVVQGLDHRRVGRFEEYLR